MRKILALATTFLSLIIFFSFIIHSSYAASNGGGGLACGKSCIYSQGGTCYQGTCLDNSQSCSTNFNCGYVSGCSTGSVTTCPSSPTATPTPASTFNCSSCVNGCNLQQTACAVACSVSSGTLTKCVGGPSECSPGGVEASCASPGGSTSICCSDFNGSLCSAQGNGASCQNPNSSYANNSAYYDKGQLNCPDVPGYNNLVEHCYVPINSSVPTATPTPIQSQPSTTGTQNVCTNPCYIVAGANNSCYASVCLSNNPADCAYPMSSMCSQNYSACGVSPVASSFCQVSSNYTITTDLPSADSCVASLPSSITITTTGFPSGKSLYLFWNPGNNQLVAMGNGTTPSFTTPFASAIPASGLTPGTYALDIFVDPIQAANGAIGGTYAEIPYTIDPSCSVSPTTAPTGVTTAPTGVTVEPTGVTIVPTGVTTAPTDVTVEPTGVTIAPTGVTTAPTGVTIAPSATITPSFPPSDTLLSLTIGLTGIGAVGDQTNPSDSSLSNQNPLDTSRTIHVYAINDAGQTSYIDGTVNYDSSGDANNGYYTGTVDMGNLPSGNYQIMAKMDGYLRKAVPSLVQVTAQSTTTVPEITLVAGDINNDNSISILDYGLLMACVTAYYVDGGPDAGCPQSQYRLADLNDDGVVDLSDYNLWLRNSSVEYGD